MQISHDEARSLVQFNSNRELNSDQQNMLASHLEECDACRAYAVGLEDVENTLRQVMHKQWDLSPLPLSVDFIRPQNTFKRSLDTFFTLRTSLASITLITIMFFIWEFTVTAYNSSEQAPLNILPVPTPSIQLSTTSSASPKCDGIIYKVKGDDTIAGIAKRFSVSKEEIMSFNNMQTEVLYKSMELDIPQCNTTPTGTAHSPTAAQTFTPILDLTIDTPG